MQITHLDRWFTYWWSIEIFTRFLKKKKKLPELIKRKTINTAKIENLLVISFFIFLMDSFFNLIKENKMMGEYSLKVFISVKGFGISIYFLSSLNIIFDIFFHFPSIKKKKKIQFSLLLSIYYNCICMLKYLLLHFFQKIKSNCIHIFKKAHTTTINLYM